MEGEINPDIYTQSGNRTWSSSLIAQLIGRLTTNMYKYAIVFVDQVSKLGYVYMQKTNNALEMFEAKKVFQQHSMDKGVVISTYHADNGIFRSNDWQTYCRDERQQLTFAGVNTHFTNRMAENRIRYIQKSNSSKSYILIHKVDRLHHSKPMALYNEIS